MQVAGDVVYLRRPWWTLMTDVFISYAHADKERVTDLVRGLETLRVGVWWDEHLPPGTTWDDQIEAALERAQAVVVVWSKHAVDSPNVKDEAHYALEERKAFPVRIEDVKLPYRWRRMQYIDLFRLPPQSNDKWTTLVDAVRAGGDTTAESLKSDTERPRSASLAQKGAIFPAALVLLSIVTQFAGTLAAPGGSTWPLLVSAGFGGAALISALWSILPPKVRVYS
jgi:hypothetical protein